MQELHERVGGHDIATLECFRGHSPPVHSTPPVLCSGCKLSTTLGLPRQLKEEQRRNPLVYTIRSARVAFEPTNTRGK